MFPSLKVKFNRTRDRFVSKIVSKKMNKKFKLTASCAHAYSYKLCGDTCISLLDDSQFNFLSHRVCV